MKISQVVLLIFLLLFSGSVSAVPASMMLAGSATSELMDCHEQQDSFDELADSMQLAADDNKAHGCCDDGQDCCDCSSSSLQVASVSLPALSILTISHEPPKLRALVHPPSRIIKPPIFS